MQRRIALFAVFCLIVMVFVDRIAFSSGAEKSRPKLYTDGATPGPDDIGDDDDDGDDSYIVEPPTFFSVKLQLTNRADSLSRLSLF